MPLLLKLMGNDFYSFFPQCKETLSKDDILVEEIV